MDLVSEYDPGRVATITSELISFWSVHLPHDVFKNYTSICPTMHEGHLHVRLRVLRLHVFYPFLSVLHQ